MIDRHTVYILFLIHVQCMFTFSLEIRASCIHCICTYIFVQCTKKCTCKWSWSKHGRIGNWKKIQIIFCQFIIKSLLFGIFIEMDTCTCNSIYCDLLAWPDMYMCFHVLGELFFFKTNSNEHVHILSCVNQFLKNWPGLL